MCVCVDPGFWFLDHFHFFFLRTKGFIIKWNTVEHKRGEKERESFDKKESLAN